MDEQQRQIIKIFLKGFKENLKASDALAEEMRRLIDDAVAEAAKLGAGVKDPVRFAFANNASLRKRLEAIISRLCGDITCKIEQGSRDAWTMAEATNAAVISALAANNAALAQAMSAGLTKKATDRALAGWLGRKTAGLGLSDRVWNLTSRLKTEMEQAIEIALAQGTPAAKLSQEVRHCLQNPDNYFRRFRYQKQIPLFERDGSPKIDPATGKQAVRKEWARKWKRRYVDKEGNVRWQDVDLNDYRYGPGVYRSNYKNAMRLARTEVNMAYLASDHERWKASWWITGTRIALSNNHPVKDICDILAGDYPPDFKFTGWHPQCRCSAVGLTMSHAEICEYQRRKKAGEDMTRYEVSGLIKEPPQAFKEWVTDNIHRFKDPSKLPYFLRDNAKYIGHKQLKSTATAKPRELSIQEMTKETPLEKFASRKFKSGGEIQEPTIGSQTKQEKEKNRELASFMAQYHSRKLRLLPHDAKAGKGITQPDCLDLESKAMVELKCCAPESSSAKSSIQNAIKEATRQKCSEVIIGFSTQISRQSIYQGLMAALQPNRAMCVKTITIKFVDENVKRITADKFRTKMEEIRKRVKKT